MSKTPERELSAEETTAGASGAVQDSPYHRSPEEMAKLPTIDSTLTVCPECKLVIEGTIYKDGDNVMIISTALSTNGPLRSTGKITICTYVCGSSTTRQRIPTIPIL